MPLPIRGRGQRSRPGAASRIPRAHPPDNTRGPQRARAPAGGDRTGSVGRSVVDRWVIMPIPEPKTGRNRACSVGRSVVDRWAIIPIPEPKKGRNRARSVGQSVVDRWATIPIPEPKKAETSDLRFLPTDWRLCAFPTKSPGLRQRGMTSPPHLQRCHKRATRSRRRRYRRATLCPSRSHLHPPRTITQCCVWATWPRSVWAPTKTSGLRQRGSSSPHHRPTVSQACH